MSMDPYDWNFCPLLKQLVEEGEVPMSRIDDAVRRVLRLKYRLNLFEKPYYDLKDFPLFGSAEHAAAALRAAEESLVLLKNTDVGQRQETAGYRSECQLHALPQRRLVLLLAGRQGG